jgi:apolipoprotein N-acyltransferase
VTIALAVGHFALPFFFLMSRTMKRNASTLVLAALWLLAMHFVDVYWLVVPSIEGLGARPGIVDVAAVLTVGGAFLALFGRLVVTSPLVPAGDPRLAESLAFENV